MTGASNPPPLPPVLMMSTAVPPRRPPTSTAVDQKDPSQAPTTPSARLNQATIHAGSFATMPSPSSAAPEIGRASCRERVQIAVGAAAIQKNDDAGAHDA